MGRLRKEIKKEIELFSNKSFFVNNPQDFKSNWNNVFQNKNDIEIEIGCGKGKFIVEKALKFPEINFIAIDKFATILYSVLQKATLYQNQIKNLKILCFDVKEILSIFDLCEISKIYLNFSDPWPKKHHEKFRLTSTEFTKKFFNILKENGLIEFKTDNQGLYEYTLNQIEKNNYKLLFNTNDLYSNKLEENVQTEYEIKWLKKNIKIKKIIFSN